jgi:1,4-dihydroxy-2-naphthoyl-CoA hydrolase
MIWKVKPTPDVINQMNAASMAGHLGIELLECGDDFIKAKMPVDYRTRQPMGLLHGGASVVLSETLGSIASFCMLDDPQKDYVVGVEINANHLKSAKEGWVIGITRPIKVGRTLHVWNTEIFDEEDNLLCTSRLTVMVIRGASGN